MVTVCTYSAVLAEGSNIVYTYMDENGQTVNITQAELDAEHWNVDALGGTLPFIYEEFPMSLEKYVSDLEELSINITYMKNIDDMDSVSLKLTDLDTQSDIYNNTLTSNSFYSPVLEINKMYKLELTEVLDGETTVYTKFITAQKKAAEMPDYVNSSDTTSTSEILIANVDTLNAGYSTNENGQIVIDSRVAKYDNVKACDFVEYVSELPSNETYRIYAKDGDIQYAGFLSSNDKDYIYDLDINVQDSQYPTNSLAANSISELEDLELTDIWDNAEYLRLTDAKFRITNSSSIHAQYKLYTVQIPQSSMNKEDNIGDIFNLTITGTEAMRMRMWTYIGSTITEINDATEEEAETFISRILAANNYKNSSNNAVNIYFMIYFPETLTGKGVVEFSPIMGYDDDVTGSAYAAYYDNTAPEERSNTEFTLTDGWDVDTFFLNYTGTNENPIYKIEFRNRSLADQALLEQGQPVDNTYYTKYITLISASENSNNEFERSEYAVYSVPENTDMIIYNNWTFASCFSVQHEPFMGTTLSNKYQISYTLMPANSN